MPGRRPRSPPTRTWPPATGRSPASTTSPCPDRSGQSQRCGCADPGVQCVRQDAAAARRRIRREGRRRRGRTGRIAAKDHLRLGRGRRRCRLAVRLCPTRGAVGFGAGAAVGDILLPGRPDRPPSIRWRPPRRSGPPSTGGSGPAAPSTRWRTSTARSLIPPIRAGSFPRTTAVTGCTPMTPAITRWPPRSTSTLFSRTVRRSQSPRLPAKCRPRIRVFRRPATFSATAGRRRGIRGAPERIRSAESRQSLP